MKSSVPERYLTTASGNSAPSPFWGLSEHRMVTPVVTPVVTPEMLPEVRETLVQPQKANRACTEEDLYFGRYQNNAQVDTR